MAAPRIFPSWSTISLIVAAVRWLSAAAARSGERTRFAVRIPAHRSPWPVTSPPTLAARAIRPVGSSPASGGFSSSALIGLQVKQGARRYTRGRSDAFEAQVLELEVVVESITRALAAETCLLDAAKRHRLG